MKKKYITGYRIAIILAILFNILYLLLGYLIGNSYAISNDLVFRYADIVGALWLIFGTILPILLFIVVIVNLIVKSKKLNAFIVFGISAYLIYALAGPLRWYVVKGFTSSLDGRIDLDAIKQWVNESDFEIGEEQFVQFDVKMLPQEARILNPRYADIYSSKDRTALMLYYGGVATGQFGIIVLADNVSDIKEVFDSEYYIFKKYREDTYIWIGKGNRSPLIFFAAQ